MRNPFILKLGTCISALFTILVGSKAQTMSYSHAIDLGLSVMWADMNVGASKPEDLGDFYAWGETNTKSSYTEENYTFCKNGEYQSLGEYIGGTKYDVAHVKWGGDWQMPSQTQFDELRRSCKWSWGTLNGVKGFKITGPNGNSIFLPATGTNNSGDYWASTYTIGHPYRAGSMGFISTQYYDDNSKIFNWSDFAARYDGLAVRPVKSKYKAIQSTGKATLSDAVDHPAVSYKHAVDLGLSVLWSDMNVGAESRSSGGGNLYAWGELRPKDQYYLENYKHTEDGVATDNWNQKHNVTRCKYIGTHIGGTDYDVAHLGWGGRWRMPTLQEWNELIRNCNWIWTERNNGVKGYKVIGPNGKSIFLSTPTEWPGVDSRYGYYWSDESAFRNDENYYRNKAYNVYISKSEFLAQYGNRYDAMFVRPVCDTNEAQTSGTAVDLGLSVKWADINLGASAPEDYGNYYSWGVIKEKGSYNRATDYEHFNSNGKYYNIGKHISGTSYDAAHISWGGKWRMPAWDELQELYNSCTWAWTTQNGIHGYKVTGPNGNSIFLPAAGYHMAGNGNTINVGRTCCYWTDLANSENSRYAYGFYQGYDYQQQWKTKGFLRNDGLNIRPVCNYKKGERQMVAVDLGLSVKWADMNLGAAYPADNGQYYKSNEADNDLIHKELGKDWRMPTKEDFEELANKCQWYPTTRSGVKGYKVTGPNGKSIFLPAAGYRKKSQNGKEEKWNGVFYRANSSCYLNFEKSKPEVMEGNYNYYMSVRPVCRPPQAVDLGLSVKWADINVGATSPEDRGEFYHWCDQSFGTPSETESNISGSKYDVARNELGDSWRMPTSEELEELANKCTWTMINGGYKVTGPNGNSIFLPAEGFVKKGTRKNTQAACYWSGSRVNPKQSSYLQSKKNKISVKKEDAILSMAVRAVWAQKKMTKATSEQTEKQYDDYKKLNEVFLKKYAKAEGVKMLDKGVCYKVLKEGKGELPTSESKVTLNYEGKTIDGNVFMSSYTRNKPESFYINRLIPGFKEALVHMPVGSTWEVAIPQDQAYGERGNGRGVKPFSTLIFKIELISAESKKAQK